MRTDRHYSAQIIPFDRADVLMMMMMIGLYRKQTYILPYITVLAYTLVHSMRLIANRFFSFSSIN